MSIGDFPLQALRWPERSWRSNLDKMGGHGPLRLLTPSPQSASDLHFCTWELVWVKRSWRSWPFKCPNQCLHCGSSLWDQEVNYYISHHFKWGWTCWTCIGPQSPNFSASNKAHHPPNECRWKTNESNTSRVYPGVIKLGKGCKCQQMPGSTKSSDSPVLFLSVFLFLYLSLSISLI